MRQTGLLPVVLAAVAVASFLAMRFWTTPAIRAGAGGLDMFDLWMDGYSAEYARMFLARLSPEARALYLGPQRVLDTIMPVALAGLLAATGYRLVVGWSWKLAVAAALLPLVYFSFDMLENAQVAAMLRRGMASDTMAEAASRFTVLKAKSLQAALAVVIFAGVARAIYSAVRAGLKGQDDMAFTVAIDGPAAAGKGTVSKAVAAHFGFAHLDTGLLYRAVGAKVLEGADRLAAARALTAQDLEADGLRSPDVAQAASQVAVDPEVRAALVDFQRAFAARAGGAVLDGRDIGTVICPEAQAKLFVTASPQVRAERRYLELVDAGHDVALDDVLAEVIARDERDSARAAAPLKPADDAVVIDTSQMSIDEAVAAAIAAVTLAQGRAAQTASS
jgi:CMP/dCMP kinase